MKGSQYSVIKLVESIDFIENLNTLIEAANAKITAYDNWMPRSLHHDKEAELKDFLKYNFTEELSIGIHNWWLKVKHAKAMTPNWDLISTCTIKGKRGILLVEAKAHWDELNNESKGKQLDASASDNSKQNHEQIGKVIEEANTGISKENNRISISRDNCYQLSNRVAHAWWLANQGIPVVLLYLGFLDCQDMNDGKNKLFKNDEDWQRCFNEHTQMVGVDTITDNWIDCGKSEFITICKSY